MYNPLLIPPRILGAMARYAQLHVPTGAFLQAVLCNNLQQAIAHADSEVLPLLPHIVWYVHNELPGNIHGSPDAYQAHLRAGVQAKVVEQA